MNELDEKQTTEHMVRTASEWASNAAPLMIWALDLRVRDDVHGRYCSHGIDAEGRPVVTSYTAHRPLDWQVVYYHYTAPSPDSICGIHVMSADERCRLTVIDIDHHSSVDADPKTNRRYAKHVYRHARDLGLDSFLVDSNGNGGYHVWIVHKEAIPGVDAYRVGKWLIRDHSEYGLTKAPESFPKSPRHTGKRIGGWVRLPGRHHKRDHYSRVWDDDRRVWLEGAEAIRSILRVEGKHAEVGAIVPAEFTGQRAARTARTRAIGSQKVLKERPVRLAASDQLRSLGLAQAALQHLKADYYDDYDNWLAVGMALRALGDEGERLWHTWSAQSAKYDPEVLDQKWESITVAASDPTHSSLGLGSLFTWAKAAGWTFPRGCLLRTTKVITLKI